jgi:hypothetical protein
MADPNAAPLPLEELIERLRTRAADPRRRTSTQPSEFVAGVRSMDLGGLLSMGRSIADQLRTVVAANREGRVDADGYERARELQRSMTEPVPGVLPAPADAGWIARAEAALGLPLPPALRRIYGEVADGGFGPGEGLLPLSRLIPTYEDLREGGAMPRGRRWPVGLLPVVSMDPGWDCVDAASGRIVAWDPQDLSERSSETVFAGSFRELFPSVEGWLTDWLQSKTAAEAQAEMMAHVQSPEYRAEQARAAREAIGRMTAEEREAMGLPREGWEGLVWGGAGWEDPDPGR